MTNKKIKKKINEREKEGVNERRKGRGRQIVYWNEYSKGKKSEKRKRVGSREINEEWMKRRGKKKG